MLRLRRSRIALALLGAVAIASAAAPAWATPPASHGHKPSSASAAANTDGTDRLPAPPKPPSANPSAPPGITKRSTSPAPLATTTRSTATFGPALATATAGNRPGAPGANPNRSTLIVYDSTGSWGWLGEAYGVSSANLISHGSPYTMHPVATYTAGEMAAYTDVVYIGSTYNEPIPTAFLDDVLSGSRPVLWMYDNIWQLAARASNFSAQYGFSPGYFDFSVTPTVTYKGVALQRDPLAAPSGLLQTTVTDPTRASVVATATRSDGSTENWAVAGPNLTYIGEIPFSYVGFNDRYYIAADQLTLLANPGTTNPKRALVRLEDVSPNDDPNELKAAVDYLYSQRVPFTIAVIPQYLDPNGYYNNGVPVSTSLAQAPQMVSALRYALSHGGTMQMEGYTHQYSNVDNPYSGVSGDDFEFYRAHVDSSNNVAYDGPPAEDSASWFSDRIASGQQNFRAVGLTPPTIFAPPHYAESAVDYTVTNQLFPTRYDRALYFGGWCPGGNCGTGTPDYTKLYGQYFPFLVRDIYGTTVVPEDLGNVEPLPYNNHPPRLPADILATSQAASVITGVVQSFFYHPYLGTSYLQQIVSGLQSQGYTFASAATVASGG